MADPAGKPFVLDTLAGGFDDSPPTELDHDKCTFANNVEFWLAPLGARRNGCDPLDITSSGLATESHLVHVSQWFPANDVTVPEYWGISATPGVSVKIAKRTAGVWSAITPIDAILTAVPNIFGISSQPGPASVSPNGKLFFAYPSGVDRLHVQDPNNGAVLRRVGLAQPSPPTVVNGALFAVPATSRYYRIRIVRQSGVGATVAVRSEPSTSVVFVPDGVHAPRITHPVFDTNESATHWEVEGSFNGTDFYVLQSLAIATATWDDTFTDPISFSAEGPLSEDIGTYLLPHSARFLLVDGDRMVMASHWSDKSLMSTVWWTPVFTDPGKGNDERLPLTVNNSRSLDNYEGGPITGIAPGVSGSWYVFKASRIYKMTRTNDPTNAYAALTLTTERGAVLGSVVPGLDAAGRACIYFTDPQVGPCMLGSGGLQLILGLVNTWERVNLKAANVIVRGCYYKSKKQTHWWLAVDGADSPNFKIILQTDEMVNDEDGSLHRGWSTATGRITEAFCCAMLTESVTEDGHTVLRTKPVIGLTSPDFLQRCDNDSVLDAGVAYAARLRSAPFILAGLLDKAGAMNAAILVEAAADVSVVVRLIRDMGKETTADALGTVSCAPESTETHVIVKLDDLALSEALMVQVEFADVS